MMLTLARWLLLNTRFILTLFNSLARFSKLYKQTEAVNTPAPPPIQVSLRSLVSLRDSREVVLDVSFLSATVDYYELQHRIE